MFSVSVPLFCNAIFVTALALSSLRQCWECVELYRHGETGVTMTIKKSEDTRFPAIGITPGWNLSAMGGYAQYSSIVFGQIQPAYKDSALLNTCAFCACHQGEITQCVHGSFRYQNFS